MPRKKRKKYNKSKGIAILLAVLFGLFGWLYTYKKDYWKFWTALCIWLFSISLGYAVDTLVAWIILIVVIIDRITKPYEYYQYIDTTVAY